MVGFGLHVKWWVLQLIVVLGAFVAPLNAIAQPNYEYRILYDEPQVWYPSGLAPFARTHLSFLGSTDLVV
jgi:hypothetical protein